jgi:hypothetical protein
MRRQGTPQISAGSAALFGGGGRSAVHKAAWAERKRRHHEETRRRAEVRVRAWVLVRVPVRTCVHKRVRAEQRTL